MIFFSCIISDPSSSWRGEERIGYMHACIVAYCIQVSVIKELAVGY